MGKKEAISTSLTITCRSDRGISDDGWEEFYPGDISVWQDACLFFAATSYQDAGRDIAIQVDWRPIVRRLRHNHKVFESGFSGRGKAGAIDTWKRYRGGHVRVPCVVLATPTRRQKGNNFHPGMYVANFMYDVFLALNIALPGSCSFYKSTVTSNFKKYPWELGLSNYWFETFYLNGQENRWPKAKNLPLHAVHNWLKRVRPGLTQIPNSQMEKVVFALWHICISDVQPNTIIWIFYALETLFDTKAGENFRTLRQRIGMLLSATEDQDKLLGKQLRNLYDLRSSFVHGGLEVIHPLHSELLDPRVEEKYWRIARACEFGFSVLLRSLQEVVNRNLSELRYREEIVSADYLD